MRSKFSFTLAVVFLLNHFINFTEGIVKGLTGSEEVPSSPTEKVSLKEHPESDDKKSTSSSSTDGPEVEFSFVKTEALKAWSSANKISGRNPNIWRLDKKKNIILSNDFTISSPLAFRALIQEDPIGSRSFLAVQGEYFGAEDDNNHINGLKFKPKDKAQDDLLSLIEIALMGNVSDDQGEPFCWCPSLIHQDLFGRDVHARRWHKQIFDLDPKYGMAGHNLAFQHMRIALKNVKFIPEGALDSMNQMHTTMYIHNYQSQCSEVIDQVHFLIDSIKNAQDVNNNWGLPRITSFIDTGDLISPSFSVLKTNKPKTLIRSSAIKYSNSVKSTMSVSELEWPSLSSSGKKVKSSNVRVI